jgi:predicted Zn finger-like uncharacterized protein
MIVQCRKCETKFRFDEAIISGEGVWVRCGVCKNVFFQDNPHGKEKDAVPPENASRDGEPAFLGGEPVVIPETRAAGVELSSAGLPETGNADTASAVEPEGFLPDDEPDDEEGLLPEEKRQGAGIGKVMAYSLVIVLVLGGVALWLFSPSGIQGLPASFGGQALTEWVSSLPLVDKFVAKAGRQKDFGIGQVKIQDLKQHLVKNMLLGDLQVLEGTAVNGSEYVISRVQVRGRIYDGAGAVLSERISFCGNILTGEELASMTEDDMQKVLSLPLGREVSNDQIAAAGRLPFMIVFAHVPPAAAKTTALPVGAERLLQ